jgi:2'-5' RNA ligase
VNYRLFVCIELPERELRRVEAFVAGLRGLRSSVRWVAPSNMHLTLAFLGDAPASQVPAIASALDAATSRPRFELCLRGTGAFPTLRRPRVFWVGFGGDIGELGALQTRVAEELERVGFPRDERPYSPHLTLGRVKDDRDPALREVASRLEGDRLLGEPFEVADIVLMRSELGPHGARYTPLHMAALSQQS